MTLRRSLILFAVSLAVLAASILGYRTGHALTDGTAGTPGSAAGAATSGPSPIPTGPSDWLEIPVPDVEFATLDGGTARLSDFRGQVVVLNFWGTWCPPCRVEIPHLVRAQESLAAMGATIIAPAVGSGSPADILSFAEDYGINYPIWIVSDAVAVTRFAAPGYPFTMLISADGVIRRTYVGPQTEETLVRDVGLLVAESAGGQPTG